MPEPKSMPWHALYFHDYLGLSNINPGPSGYGDMDYKRIMAVRIGGYKEIIFANSLAVPTYSHARYPDSGCRLLMNGTPGLRLCEWTERTSREFLKDDAQRSSKTWNSDRASH